MTRRFGPAARALLAASTLALTAFMAFVVPAAAVPADPPESGDPRATAHAGNAATCEDAGLAGEIVEVEFLIDETNRFIFIGLVPSDVELTGIVVKGGPAYNVYGPDARLLLHSPLNSGGIAQISHWFVCGQPVTPTTSETTTTTDATTTTESTTTESTTTTTEEETTTSEETTTTDATTTTESTTTTTEEETTTESTTTTTEEETSTSQETTTTTLPTTPTSEESTTTKAPTTTTEVAGVTATTTTEAQASTTPPPGGGTSGDNLASTGFSGRGLLIAGVGLLTIGLGLVFGVRATRRRGDNTTG